MNRVILRRVIWKNIVGMALGCIPFLVRAVEDRGSPYVVAMVAVLMLGYVFGGKQVVGAMCGTVAVLALYTYDAPGIMVGSVGAMTAVAKISFDYRRDQAEADSSASGS